MDSKSAPNPQIHYKKKWIRGRFCFKFVGLGHFFDSMCTGPEGKGQGFHCLTK